MLLRPFLDDAREALGPDRLDRILREAGVGSGELDDAQAWVSFELVQLVYERLWEEREDPALLERCGRLSLTPRYIGVLRPLFRAFGSPMFTFNQVVQSTGRFNKVGRMEMVGRGWNRVTIAYRPFDEAPVEHSPLVCRVRQANLAAIPTMFDLPPAQAKHPTCIHRGDDACVYELAWWPARPRIRGWLGLLLGGAAGGLTAWLLATGPGVGVALAVSAALGLGGVGRSLDLSRDLGERASDFAEQQEALTQSVRANEERFEELQRAKAEVDRKVEERTTELQQTSDRLAETLEEVQALDHAKTQFFANVSHELRTPLQLLLGPLDDLLAGREPPGGREAALAAMQRNASRLLHVINQLLDVTKIDAGEMRIRRAAVDPGALVRRVTEGFSATARERGIELSVEAPGDMPVVPLDASWIESAVTNLVANAIRVLGEGGQVVVRAVDRGAEVVIEVQDDGPGLSAEERERIFDRFAQAGDSSVRRGGTGLGLAITREAARLHGGDASASEAPGGGTLFTLTLPRVPLEAAAEDVGDARAGAVEPASEAAEPASVALDGATLAGERSRVADRTEAREGPSEEAPLALVIEDDPDLRMHLADVLAARYRVVTAVDGVAGLRLARQQSPEVIVSDIAMPRMDGIELVRAVREDEDTSTIPVVLVTAYDDPGRTMEAFDAGANDFVSKPFHGRELLARVDVHVRLRRMVREMTHRDRLATLGLVAASIAHQIRNPLTALVSGLPAIHQRLEGALDGSTQDMFDVLVDCVQRIERMTVDLLDLSRVDREEEGHFRPGTGLMASARLVSSRMNADAEVDAEADESAQLVGRAGDLNHVFLNLLDNAVKAAGPDGQIQVRGQAEGEQYVVRVGDSGPGVSEADRERIFDPFWTTRAPGEGTGLGLAIAHQVVLRHGGSIEVGASPLGGALFTVRLPGIVADAADAEEPADRLRSSA